MPEPQVFGAWTASVVEKADATFTEMEEKKAASWPSWAATGMSRCKRTANPMASFRCSPPPPGMKPVEPWFEDQSEDDDDGGPETTH
jgi:hypothetical protein